MKQERSLRKGIHMEDWTCLKCGFEIDHGREYYGFNEEKQKYFHTAPCPITYTEEEGYEKEMMHQDFLTD